MKAALLSVSAWASLFAAPLASSDVADAQVNVPNTGELAIEASGFNNSSGQAIAKIFRPGDDVLVKGRWQVIASISRNGTATFRLAGIPSGQYAVVVLHDENNNGTIDHRLFMPIEQLGFSNGFKLGPFSGLPTFKKLEFAFSSPSQTMKLHVR